MFQRAHRFHASIKAILDLLMVAAAFAIAYVLRFQFEFLRPLPLGFAPERETLSLLVAIVVVWPVVFSTQGLYASGRAKTHFDELFGVFKATVVGTLIVVAITYFGREERYSRLTLGLFALLAFVLVSIARVAFREVLRALRRRGHNLRDILVIGAGELGQQVVRSLRDHQELGFRVAGFLSRKAEKVGSDVEGAKVLGTLDDLDRVLAETHADQVIIALPSEEQAGLKKLVHQLTFHTVDVKVVPDLYQYITLSGGLEEFGGLPIVSLQHGPLQGWSWVAKRAFDVFFSLVALALLAPVMLVAAVLVKLTSKGPVFYAQERMGMDGEVFRILKFRSMRTDSEVAGAQMASKVDPRRTAFGTFIRKTSIDELPQLFNVLMGDMSMVGPRPERPVFIEEFKKQIPRYHLRHKVKAGITGWAQINGLRGQTSIEKRIEYDLYYIENWSLVLDFKICVRTVLGGFLSKNAY
ncbi:MAG: undecaprenyl-phosphate glucose phosphotransferase [Deltaproteobacteria bacterium]|nr:undecaprenyl-phosphate glucose phosphotransferase [Deltaproteobacteria bacterium]